GRSTAGDSPFRSVQHCGWIVSCDVCSWTVVISDRQPTCFTMSSSQIAEPWNSFLSDLDRGLSTRLVLHCLGGFAINLTYGLSRQPADIDMCEVAPITTKTDILAL